MSTTNALDPSLITTAEQVRSAIQQGTSLGVLLKHSPYFQARAEEHRELVRLAAPLYKEALCSMPFYKAREHDDQFWESFIGSGVTAARNIVARAKSTGRNPLTDGSFDR